MIDVRVVKRFEVDEQLPLAAYNSILAQFLGFHIQNTEEAQITPGVELHTYV